MKGTRRETRIWIMVRDDWTCQLCELAIPDLPAEEYNNILYGNCDHIIPRAVGGSGRRENLQAAHNFCNNLKSFSYPDEWPPSEYQTHLRKAMELSGAVRNTYLTTGRITDGTWNDRRIAEAKRKERQLTSRREIFLATEAIELAEIKEMANARRRRKQ